MASLFGLDCLARFAPQIFGRALSLDVVLNSSPATLGRPDRLDAHTPDVRQALMALRLLDALARSGEEGRRAARVLAYLHVVCGEEARRQSDTWVCVALTICPLKKPPKQPLPTEERARYAAQGLALYAVARAHWSAL